MTGISGSILVVDDNRMNRIMLSHSLEQQGHTVMLAENGRQALTMMHAQQFDLVLLDIVMPERKVTCVMRMPDMSCPIAVMPPR